MNNNTSLAKAIKEKLDELSITQSELSRKLGVSRTDVCILIKNLEKNKSITTGKLFKIAKALNIHINFDDK